MATINAASAATMTTPLLLATMTPKGASKALPDVMAATNSGRSSPPAALDTTKLPSSNDASDGTDSGYASFSTTPEGTPGSSREGFDSEILLPSRSLFKRKVTKLKVFDKPVLLQTQNRFNDLNELFGKALYNYLANVKMKYSAVSIKLKVLGEDEDTAKPGIVVLCDKAITNRVRRFFNQPQVKSEYQPGDKNLCLPSFEIVVCDRPPRQMASAILADIYGDCWTNEELYVTLCGKMIKADDTEHGRMATLGGIIMVKSMEGNVMLYGMTVGHIIKQEQPSDGEVDPEEDEVNDDDGDCFSDEDESFELDLPSEEAQVSSESSFGGDLQHLPGYPAQPDIRWPMIGNIVEASPNRHNGQPDLDWALVQLTNPQLYRPNRMPYSHQSPTNAHKLLREMIGMQYSTEQKRPVVLIRGTRGVKRGLLSTSSSFLMLGSGQDFVATYDLLLQEQGKSSYPSFRAALTLLLVFRLGTW